MAVTKDEIIEALKEMPALELSELVHELEDVFGVSAAAPVAVAAAAPAADAAPAEEKTNFDVELTRGRQEAARGGRRYRYPEVTSAPFSTSHVWGSGRKVRTLLR